MVTKRSNVPRKRKAPPEKSTGIYTNRANRYVIDRMLSSGFRKLHDDNQKQLLLDTEELHGLTATSVGTTGASDLVGDMVLEHRRAERRTLLQTKIDEAHQHLQEAHWSMQSQRVRNTHAPHIARLIIANRLLGRPTEIFYSDPDTCQACHELFVFDHTTSLVICPRCGQTQKVLFVSEDLSQDLLVGKDPLSAGRTSMAVVTKTHVYMRSPLYRRFLRQFSDTAPPIPIAVMRVLYKYLSNIHLQTSVRCRPTPVATILRNHGHSKWANSSIVISKQFNGEPIPRMNQELIDRLVHRFDMIFQASAMTKPKQKVPCFEFVTHLMLFVEGRRDLAPAFSVHKTRAVLQKSCTSITDLLPHLRELSAGTDYDWNDIPML